MTARLTIIAVSLFMFGCGGAPQAGKSIHGSGTPVDCHDNNCFQAKPQKVATVISHRQIMPNFQRCLGLTSAQVRAATKTVYKESISTFSLEGDANDVSAPMMMAVMGVASELCLDLINVEKGMASGRKFFPGFNLGGASNSQSYNLNKTLQDLAKACWGRDINSKEINIISKDITSNTSASAALYACTAILSSAQAVKF